MGKVKVNITSVKKGSGVDLHLHTCESDGKYTPEEIVSRAVLTGLSVIAITDHDTIN